MAITSAPRKLKRTRQVMSTLARHGLGAFAAGARRWYTTVLPHRKARPGVEAIPVEVRVRIALEELGTTFIKLGQVLSMRPDLIPHSLAQELEKLQDKAAPLPFDVVEKELARALGPDFREQLGEIEPEPLASASIAQVHRATLPSGEIVVLKIRRPGIKRQVETDLAILHDLARMAERTVTELELIEPTRIVEEFARTIRREMDFIREARNVERFRRHFRNDPTIYVPQLYWQFCRENLLVMEWIDGIKVSDVERLREAGLDPKIIAIRGAQAILKQVFEHGFFHADPHGANVFVIKGNVIVPLDYGMMGSLDDRLVRQIEDLLIGIVRMDVDRIMTVLENLGSIRPGTDTRSLYSELYDFLDRYYHVPLYQLNTPELVGELLDIVRRYRLRLPPDLVLMIRSLMLAEAGGRRLYPEFDMMTLAKPYVKRIIMRRLSLKRRIKEAPDTLEEVETLVRLAPKQVQSILSKASQGELSVRVDPAGIPEILHELDRSSNRLAFAMICAALVIGSSITISAGFGPFLFGFPLLGVVGFGLAALLGFWLLFSIMRGGKL